MTYHIVMKHIFSSVQKYNDKGSSGSNNKHTKEPTKEPTMQIASVKKKNMDVFMQIND